MTVVQKIVNMDRAKDGEVSFIPCAWDDCESDAVQLHQARFHDHPRPMRCDDLLAKHLIYAFCSEGHRQLWLNGHRAYGRLPSGARGRLR